MGSHVYEDYDDPQDAITRAFRSIEVDDKSILEVLHHLLLGIDVTIPLGDEKIYILTGVTV